MKIDTSGTSSIARNASFIFSAKFLALSLKTIYVFALVRQFGPELYGLYAHGQAWYLAFLPMTMLGIGPMLARELGRGRSGNPSLVGQTLTLKLTGVIAAALLCGTLGWILAAEPLARLLALIFAAALLARGMSSWNEQVFAAFEATQYIFRQERLFRPLEVSAGLLLLSLGESVLAIATLHTASWGLQALHGFLIVRRELTPARLEGSGMAVLQLFVHGLPVAIAMTLNGWMVQGPLVLYGYLNGADDQLGQLALALQVFFLSLAVPTAIASAAMPVLARAISVGQGKDLLYLSVMSRAGGAIGTLAGILGAAGGTVLIERLFGDKYLEASYLLGPALWLLVPFIIGNAASTVLAAQGRFGNATIGAVIGAATMSVAIKPLSATLGPIGAIIAAGSGMLAWALIGTRLAVRGGDCDARQVTWGPLGGAAASIATTWLLAPFGAAVTTLGGVAALSLAYIFTGAVSRTDICKLKQLWIRWRKHRN